VLLVLVLTYDVTVTIKKSADRAAARNVINTILHDICTHHVVGCRVT
jgi:hypothetical protein